MSGKKNSEPHVEISLREIYDKMVNVEKIVREMRAEQKSLAKYKTLMYPTMVTAAAALVTTFVK